MNMRHILNMNINRVLIPNHLQRELLLFSCVYRMKVKGEKHSVSKVKTLAAVDVEKVNSVKECVDKVCTVNRMKQGFDYLAEQGLDRIPQNLGVYLKWLNGDIFKEELDTIVESGLTPKDMTKEISNLGRKFFLENM